MLINEKILQPRIGTKETEQKEADEITEENQVIIAGFGRFGSVTGRLLNANDLKIKFIFNYISQIVFYMIIQSEMYSV